MDVRTNAPRSVSAAGPMAGQPDWSRPGHTDARSTMVRRMQCNTRRQRITGLLQFFRERAAVQLSGTRIAFLDRRYSSTVLDRRPIHGAVFPPRSALAQKSILGSCRTLFKPMPPPRVSLTRLYCLLVPPWAWCIRSSSISSRLFACRV
jgi:hypothetical protein